MKSCKNAVFLILYAEKVREARGSGDKFHLANGKSFCYNQFRYLRRVGISVLQRLPKPASDRNENLVFATVLRRKGVRETKLSRYLSGYKILYLQG